MPSTSRAPSSDRQLASPFEIYLRTGRRVRAVEVKFNPWHDPDNGRFTYSGTGKYVGRADGRSASASTPNYDHFSPRHPNNHTIYVVKQGDTLTRIAKLRNGLTMADLAWVNSLPNADSLRVGQRLMLPKQAYLDRGRRARENILNLDFYMETHGGRLPPNVAKVPTIEEQLNSNWRREVVNGYAFDIDVINRARRFDGEVTFAPMPRRSKRLQAQAGGADRRSTDDGGHYVAVRFNGPLGAFNHFAQDANFNRGAYRELEREWAQHIRAGRRVFIEGTVQYEGTSVRPSSLRLIWFVNGRKFEQTFANEKKGK